MEEQCWPPLFVYLKDKFLDSALMKDKVKIGIGQDRGNGRVLTAYANLNKVDDKDNKVELEIINLYDGSDWKDNLVITMEEILDDFKTITEEKIVINGEY